MTSYLKEAFYRGSQSILGLSIFDLIPLYWLRVFFYKRLFSIDGNVSISSGFALLKPHFGKLKNHRCELNIGTGFSVNRNVEIDYSGGVDIGKNVWISQSVIIETHEHKIEAGKIKDDWNIEHSHLYIGDNAWIGANAIILSKCNLIGENSIIGAGSVVVKNVPANCIVAGNPAKVIRKL
ncbi:acyltransferase [Vibrio sp. TH_r3]|uniref:acyltransferase n=1 Tax=Vibrio sp. TH_r3 TaxID=3082084 RepID=UPI0029546AB8|nr:acyltransferase [Vibrio sp. TH_r3]MDV7104211.1 acyltransferase [Vibrio sp. TH_r3]